MRFGIQQTPLLDYEEGIYRYRFQGTTFTEREGFYNSADAGVSFHTNFPNNYGEVHAGLYNGDGYARPEQNDRHAFDIRGTLRPFAQGAPVLRGLRVTGYYVADDYVKERRAHARRRPADLRAQVPERRLRRHRRPRSDLDHQSQRRGQRLVVLGDAEVAESRRLVAGTAAALRPSVPNQAALDQTRQRTIAGVAYWFRTAGSIQSALLLDYDGQTFDNFVPAQPKN